MSKLTAAKIKSISKPRRYGDGGTLFLNVALGGSKSWIQRLTIKGRRHDIGLGSQRGLGARRSILTTRGQG